MGREEKELMEEFDRCHDNVKEFTQIRNLDKYEQSEVDEYVNRQWHRMHEITKELDRFMSSENRGELREYRSDVIAEIDDLNQYLEGNVTKMGLIEGLEGLLRILRK